MKRSQKMLVIILRIAVGWFLFYQGVAAILDPNWSIVGNIQSASTFPSFYNSIVYNPATLQYATYLIKGAYILAGGFLLIGLFVRLGALIGILIMLFFYFPALSFPNVRGGYYIVDVYLLNTLVLAYLFVVRAGEFFGLGTLFRFSRY